MPTQGVIYYNKGVKCIVRLILCINSLRRYYKGPITVFIEGKQPPALLEDLHREYGVDFIEDSNPNSATLVRKIEISRKTPYDYSLFIDADMLIFGDISDFFEGAKTHDLVASHFTDWKSNGGTISKRIKRFQEYKPSYMKSAIDYGPAINTGIYAFPKDSPIWDEWWDTAMWGQKKGIYIPDEVACQVIAPQYKVKVLSSKYNVSVVYGEHIKDRRVIHFHGRKHCKEYRLCELWIKEFKEACRTNLCHIRDYLGGEYGEKRLTRFLKGKYGWKEHVQEIKQILSKKPMSNDQKNKVVSIENNLGNITKIDVVQLPKNAIILTPKEQRAKSREDRRRRRADKNKKEIPEIILTDSTPRITSEQLLKEEPKTVPINLYEEVTVVTAIDKNYIGFLEATFSNWVKYKSIQRYPMIIYINGFESVNDPSLSFIKRYNPRAQIIMWDMPEAKSQREKMLSSFVFGAARDVKTKYWLKLDADAFFTDKRPMLDEGMLDYVICGHKWGYTKPGTWINDLDEWAKTIKIFEKTKNIFNPINLGTKRYIHERTASYVQLHQTEFTKFAAALCDGGRLPVPSHDTYLWYVAARLNLPIMRHNFKRHRGVTNVPRLDKLKRSILEVEQQQK
jgi:hypothetical protein